MRWGKWFIKAMNRLARVGKFFIFEGPGTDAYISELVDFAALTTPTMTRWIGPAVLTCSCQVK